MTHYSESANHRWTYHSWPITSGRFHSQPIIDGRHHTAVLAWGGGLKRTSLFSLKTFTDAHQNFTRHKCRLLITLSSLRLKKDYTVNPVYTHRFTIRDGGFEPETAVWTVRCNHIPLGARLEKLPYFLFNFHQDDDMLKKWTIIIRYPSTYLG